MRGRISRAANRETASYLVCGVLTTIVGYAVFFACERLDATVAAANAVSTVVAVAFAFVVNKRFVFLSLDWSFKKTAAEFGKFCAGRTASFAAETGALILLVDYLRFPSLICKAFTMTGVVVLNYIFGKLIFKK